MNIEAMSLSEVEDILSADGYPLRAKTRRGDIVRVAKVARAAVAEGRCVWTKSRLRIVGDDELDLCPGDGL